MTHHAYDYKAQRWIEGEPARLLLIQSFRETLDLLESARGDDYARNIGADKHAAIANARLALAELG